MRGYVVTIRSGPRVKRERFGELPAALEALEHRGREREQKADAHGIDQKVGRRFDPVQQVVARLELVGRGRLRGGVDVRGDGSSEPYLGKLRRRLVFQREDESAYEALRRVLAD